MNLVSLIGRAGRDPEVRYFESGTMVANLTLAVNAYKRDEAPDWFNLEIWGKQAQVAADYVRQGSQLAVYGRINQQKWTDRTSGEEKSKWVVTVDRLELLGKKRDNESGDFQTPAPQSQPQSQGQPAAATRSAAPAPAAQQAWSGNDSSAASDDDIPF